MRFANPAQAIHGMRLGEHNGPIGPQTLVEFLQDLCAPGKERIAWVRDTPVRSERGETGFQQLARLVIIKAQDPGQFKNHPLALWQEIATFPGTDRAAMHAKLFRQALLSDVLAAAKASEDLSKRGKGSVLHAVFSPENTSNVMKCRI